ncbi:MAG: T9SS type A sorting domain-containing protein [Bacteroidetes bacterium]|nr:T9SS type A sorting domain-containing protein [Bacteroidota bacterium]
MTELKITAAQVQRAFDLGAWDSLVDQQRVSDPAVPNLAAALGDNFPEPFSEKTTIRFRLPHPASVRLSILDLLGREIETLVNEPRKEGNYSVVFNGSGLPSGVYIYRIEIDHALGFGTMVLQK